MSSNIKEDVQSIEEAVRVGSVCHRLLCRGENRARVCPNLGISANKVLCAASCAGILKSNGPNPAVFISQSG